MQSTTVYRFAHPETMQTVLQIRATFCQSIKLTTEKIPPHASSPAPLMGNDKESLEEIQRLKEARRKEIQRCFILSKSYVIIDRDTRTSNRDWKS
jgi:hypothetical protein